MKYFLSVLFFLITPGAFAGNITLALNWKAEPEFGGFYAAELQGYFKKQGLDVKIQEGGSGTPTVQMLANGKVDFAIVSGDELILSQDKNKNKVIALFAVYQTAPYIVMTHQERNFKTLKEVFTSDGVLAFQSGLPLYQFLVQKFGKPVVKIVPYLGGVSNFLADKKFSQQGFLNAEPLSAEEAGMKVKNFLIADEGYNPYVAVVAATEEFIKKNPELVRQFIGACREGWLHYLQTPEPTNKFMSSLNKSMDLATFKKSAQAQKALIDVSGQKVGAMTRQRWDTLIQQMKAMNLIKNPLKADEVFLNF